MGREDKCVIQVVMQVRMKITLEGRQRGAEFRRMIVKALYGNGPQVKGRPVEGPEATSQHMRGGESLAHSKHWVGAAGARPLLRVEAREVLVVC